MVVNVAGIVVVDGFVENVVFFSIVIVCSAVVVFGSLLVDVCLPLLLILK